MGLKIVSFYLQKSPQQIRLAVVSGLSNQFLKKRLKNRQRMYPNNQASTFVVLRTCRDRQNISHHGFE